ncbi:hypothetical protein CLU92_5451 [Janthinobacterium sp. 61]|uniref:hypothetical protein n=1 Tax=Janthinobacterium sp. 61 TaxID=2035209 RepID=UPI000C6FFF02|nr:hypothetical protein [Janthinobacterium sp. 61]PKV47976.1 hypothetical protein CLU92_5451 [Janthinobacterium sp. 61]
MFNFTFPWTKRREARKAAEQKARTEADFVRAIVAVSMRGHERAQRARADVSTAPRRTSQASTTYSAPADTGAPSSSWAPAIAPSHLAAGGGTFDGGGASGDWGGSSCSSSGSDSSSSSSDSGSSCSSD